MIWIESRTFPANCSDASSLSSLSPRGIHKKDVHVFIGHPQTCVYPDVLERLKSPCDPQPPRRKRKQKMTQDCKNVALKLPKISLKWGNLRATIFVREMLEGVFCFRGRKLPQRLYNHSNRCVFRDCPCILLSLLSRNILWIFFSYLPGNFALKNGGDFWWIFSGLRFPRNEARKILEKFGKIRSKIRGEIRDENFKNSGNFRSADFLT